MSNPSGHDQGNEPVSPSGEHGEQDESTGDQQAESATEIMAAEQPADAEPATEVFAPPPAGTEAEPAERRFTAPSGFDGSTQQIGAPPPDPATEIFAMPGPPPGPMAANTQPFAQQRVAAPQHIPARTDAPKPPEARRSWGWVVAVVLVIAALVALAVLGTVLLTRGGDAGASQEDRVRSTIESFDVAIQKGDLATLRSITCGATRDSYVRYDEDAWAETHARVAAAKQYPVVASIDQVVVNDDHAEANVTTFMAYAPQTRSTRSFDLEFRDDQWKICQAPQ